jgi:hypothetical protein
LAEINQGTYYLCHFLFLLAALKRLKAIKLYYLAINSITNPLLPLLFSLGNFETIQWFSSNGWNNIPFDESLLPIIARRGDAELFMKFLEFYHERRRLLRRKRGKLKRITCRSGQLKILQKATSKNVSLVNEEISRKEFDLEDLSQELLASAAIGGQVNVLEWIWSKFERK